MDRHAADYQSTMNSTEDAAQRAELVALVAKAKAEFEKADIAATLNYLANNDADQASLNAIAEAAEAIYEGLRADLEEAEAEFRADANGDKL